MRKITEGARPPWIPSKSWNGQSYVPIWRVAAEAWKPEPSKRPTIHKIQTMIREVGENSKLYPVDAGHQVQGILSPPSSTPLSPGPSNALSSQTGVTSTSTQVTSPNLPTTVSNELPTGQHDMTSFAQIPQTPEVAKADFEATMIKLSKNYNDTTQKVTNTDMKEYRCEIWDGEMRLFEKKGFSVSFSSLKKLALLT